MAPKLGIAFLPNINIAQKSPHLLEIAEPLERKYCDSSSISTTENILSLLVTGVAIVTT